MSRFKGALRSVAKKGVLYFVRKMPWEYQDRYRYFRRFKSLPNIRKPTLFNEKILYRKFVAGDYLRYSRLSDKYAVREHIASTIGAEYLIPLLHETDDPSTLLSLPSLKNTVVKPNHGSNMVEILMAEPDRQQRQLIVDRCQEWLHRDYSRDAHEIHYRYIKPRILVEKYIGDSQYAPIDYKFHMFNKKNGNFEYVLQVIYNRDNPALSMNFYVNNLHEAWHKIRDTGLDITGVMPKLEHALELSKVLVSDFDYVRVDWYIQKGQLWFGEFTFTPGAGLVTGLDRGLNRMMGEMWIQTGSLHGV